MTVLSIFEYLLSVQESMLELNKGISFTNLDLNPTDQVDELLQGATIQVLHGTQRFAVHNKGNILVLLYCRS